MLYLFVIDFLETVIYENPVQQRRKHAKHFKIAKKKSILYCKSPELKYCESIDVNNHCVKVMARTCSSQLIVGLLVPESFNDTDAAWSLIDAVIAKMDNADIEVNGMKSIKPDIDELVHKSLGANHNHKQNGSFDENGETETEDYHRKLSELGSINTDSVFYNSTAKSTELKDTAWNKKHFIVIIGFGLGLVTLLLFVVLAKHCKYI